MSLLTSLLEVEETELQPFTEPPTKVELDFGEFCEKVRGGMTTIVFTKFTPDDRELEYYADAFGIDESKIGMLSANTPSFERVQTQIAFKTGELQVVIATNVLAQGLNFPAQGVLIEYNEWDDWEIVTQKMGRIARPLFGLSEGYYCLSDIPAKYKNRGVPQKSEREAETYWRSSGAEVDIVGWGFMDHEVPKGFWAYKQFKYGYRFLRELKNHLGELEVAEQEALDFLEDQSRQVRELLEQRPVAA